MRITRTPALIFTSLLLVASCAYIIPPEQNAPRNNEVRGDTRRPQMNTLVPQSAVNREAPAMASQAVPQPQPAAPLNPPAGERRVPVENQPFQVSAMGYAPITDVPPRPATTGPASVPQQLRATQSELEQDRAVAQDRANTLARDAAAEPSMLSDLPKVDAVVPPPAPVRTAPLPAPMKPAPALAPLPSAPATSPQVSRPQVVASVTPAPNAQLPALPAFAPPPPTQPMPAPRVSVATPPENLAPVALPPAPVVTAYPQARAQGPSIDGVVSRKGDFDPLTVEEPGLRPIMLRPLTRTSSTASSGDDRPRFANNAQVIPERYYTHRR